MLELVSPQDFAWEVWSSHLKQTELFPLQWWDNSPNFWVTWILFPVSGVVPSIVRMISNFSVIKSMGDTSHSGEASSILWDNTIGQNSWKKSCVPSKSVPNSMANRWWGISWEIDRNLSIRILQNANSPRPPQSRTSSPCSQKCGILSDGLVWGHQLYITSKKPRFSLWPGHCC